MLGVIDKEKISHLEKATIVQSFHVSDQSEGDFTRRSPVIMVKSYL